LPIEPSSNFMSRICVAWIFEFRVSRSAVRLHLDDLAPSGRTASTMAAAQQEADPDTLRVKNHGFA
jgi:hypothetical protein